MTATARASTLRKRKRRDKAKAVAGFNKEVAVKQEEELGDQQVLPDKLWSKILDKVHKDSVTLFACVCKQMRRVQQKSGRKLETSLQSYSLSTRAGFLFSEEKLSSVSEEWCFWSMRFAKKKKAPKKQIVNAAAVWGHLDALKHFRKKSRAQTLFDEETCVFAALGGHLEVLKYAHENGRPWNYKICYAAAKGGQLEVLKYAHEKGCPWKEDTCFHAAAGGHLEVLKYLRENQCPWNEGTCYAAARYGHLEVLKYTHENGLPWNQKDYQGTWREAALAGQLEVLK